MESEEEEEEEEEIEKIDDDPEDQKDNKDQEPREGGEEEKNQQDPIVNPDEQQTLPMMHEMEYDSSWRVEGDEGMMQEMKSKESKGEKGGGEKVKVRTPRAESEKPESEHPTSDEEVDPTTRSKQKGKVQTHRSHIFGRSHQRWWWE